MRTSHLFLIFLMTILGACGNRSQQGEEQLSLSQQKQAEADLYNSLIQIHDEIMPRMDRINNIQSELESNLERLRADAEGSSGDSTAIKESIQLLDSADNAMMTWMRNFEPIANEDTTRTHEEVMAYLEEEKEKIEDVQKLIDEALEKGQAVR